MSSQELFLRVESLLQRKLTPEECKFLVLASESLQHWEPYPGAPQLTTNNASGRLSSAVDHVARSGSQASPKCSDVAPVARRGPA
jgi:hypothetical protein